MFDMPDNEMSTGREANSDDNSTDSDVVMLGPSPRVAVDHDTPTTEMLEDKVCPALLTIQFHNTELYRTLESEISVAIETVFRKQVPSQFVSMRPDPERCTLDVLRTEATEGDDSLFIIDSTPRKNVKNDDPIPSYKKVMSKVYEGQTPESTPNEKTKRARVKQTCWNCEGDHGLKDCKKPRDYKRIRQNKEEFQRKAERYHADMEQKYSHLMPGRLSRELRDALGLGSRDLPRHIYNMRNHGYPPGWLEDAKITHSGLQLFDSNGDIVQHCDDGDGEDENGRCKYDVRKIVSFPGFNEPADRKMFDDYKFFNVPPYSEELSRERMIRQLEGMLVDGYRRKKLKLSVEETGCSNIVDTTANMDIVDMEEGKISPQPELPQLVPSQANEPPPPEAPKLAADELEDGELSDEEEPEKGAIECAEDSVIIVESPIEVITLDDTDVSEKRSPSPSLDDLRRKQEKLVEQLANQSVESTALNEISLEDISTATMLFDNTIATQPTRANEPLPELVLPVGPPPPPPTFAPDDSEPSAKPPEPETLNLGEIGMNKVPYLDEPGSMGLKKMSLGTPILRAFTPYSALPSGEAFSKGVSDVINFENLPNSTGKYQQMKSLLTQVRQKINDHLRHTDDER